MRKIIIFLLIFFITGCGVTDKNISKTTPKKNINKSSMNKINDANISDNSFYYETETDKDDNNITVNNTDSDKNSSLNEVNNTNTDNNATVLKKLYNDINSTKSVKVKLFYFKHKPILYINLGDIVHFDTNKYKLKEGYKVKLNKIIDVLKDTNQSILIVGHTDSVGSDRYNQGLSELRAREVYKYFIQQGVLKERLDYIGYGEEQPVATNGTDEGRAKNRRVEIFVSADLNISSSFLKDRKINIAYWNNHSKKFAGKITISQKGWTKHLSDAQIKKKMVMLQKPVRSDLKVNLKNRNLKINLKTRVIKLK